MPNTPYVWLESKQDPLASQLVTIGGNLASQGATFGLSVANIAYWQKGAAVNDYLQTQLIPAVRDFSGAATTARDEFQLDKLIVLFLIPSFIPPPMPPLVQTAIDEMVRAQTGTALPGDRPLQTDFLDWCDHQFQTMKLVGGLSESAAKALGFLVPASAPPIPPAQMQPRITSIDTEANGKTTVKVLRGHAKMIHCRVALDSGQIFEKTLANSEFKFDLPTDRVHNFSAMAIYADNNGEDFGQWSDPKSDTSEQ